MIRSRLTKRLAAALLLLVVAAVPVPAQEPIRKVVFHTTPPEAQIYMDVSGQHTYEKFLGVAGRPLLLDLSSLKDASGFDVVIRHEGYFDKRERVGIGYFNGRDRYPENGTVRLEPINWMIPARAALRTHKLPIASGFLSCLALGFWLLYRRRNTEEALQRAARLEEYRAQAGTKDPNLLARLDRWRLIDRLGQGGSAAVYKGIPDDSLEEEAAVAIKLFSEESADSPDFVERFRREARLCRDLQHPGIVRLLDWGNQDGIFYLAMEFVDGPSLREVIPKDGMVTDDALDYIIKISEALEYAHQREIIHRDIKPENILLTSRGQIKLTDFGLAREIQSSFTKTGRALGTPGYMSPEQIQGHYVDGRCDQYSLGIVAYELLTGHRPFPQVENDPAAILFQQVHQTPMPMEQVGAQIAPDVEAIVMRMLERRPDARFPTMSAALEALKSLERGH